MPWCLGRLCEAPPRASDPGFIRCACRAPGAKLRRVARPLARAGPGAPPDPPSPEVRAPTQAAQGVRPMGGFRSVPTPSSLRRVSALGHASDTRGAGKGTEAGRRWNGTSTAARPNSAAQTLAAPARDPPTPRKNKKTKSPTTRRNKKRRRRSYKQKRGNAADPAAKKKKICRRHHDKDTKNDAADP